MSSVAPAEDAEPGEQVPAGPLFVPVRPGPTGMSPRFFRTPLGFRTAVAFTSEQRLASLLGAHHPRIRLSEPALRALADLVGIALLTVDPLFSAPRPKRTGAQDRTDGRAMPRRAVSSRTTC